MDDSIAACLPGWALRVPIGLSVEPRESAGRQRTARYDKQVTAQVDKCLNDAYLGHAERCRNTPKCTARGATVNRGCSVAVMQQTGRWALGETMDKKAAAEMEQYIERVTESGCWIWVGAQDSDGYGKLCRRNKGVVKMHKASRYIMGEPDAHVLHYCHVRECVNLYHLRLGDNSENQLDRHRNRRYWS